MTRQPQPQSLAQMHERIEACTLCPRLVVYLQQVAREKVRRFRTETYWSKPVPSFGDPHARVLIVGLAPAAHGGNRTGRAFTGDRSGDWLYGALHAHGFANQATSSHRADGLQLQDCYITQAVHCAPPANKPARQELAQCQDYLLAELRMLPTVRVVIPLGNIAFQAYLRAWRLLGRALPTPLPRFGHGRLAVLSEGQTLVPSYHPSQQNTHTGRLTHAMFDDIFATARRLVNALEQ